MDIVVRRRGVAQPVDSMSIYLYSAGVASPGLAARPSADERRDAPTPAASAFTLVEIMIAIGILSLVLAAIYSSWTAILRASKTGLDAAASAQRARITIRVLEDSLGSAQSFAANLPYYYFDAENGE